MGSVYRALLCRVFFVSNNRRPVQSTRRMRIAMPEQPDVATWRTSNSFSWCLLKLNDTPYSKVSEEINRKLRDKLVECDKNKIAIRGFTIQVPDKDFVCLHVCLIILKRCQQFIHYARQPRFLVLHFVLESAHLFSHAVEELTEDLRNDDRTVTVTELRQTDVIGPDCPRLALVVQKTIHLK